MHRKQRLNAGNSIFTKNIICDYVNNNLRLLAFTLGFSFLSPSVICLPNVTLNSIVTSSNRPTIVKVLSLGFANWLGSKVASYPSMPSFIFNVIYPIDWRRSRNKVTIDSQVVIGTDGLVIWSFFCRRRWRRGGGEGWKKKKPNQSRTEQRRTYFREMMIEFVTWLQEGSDPRVFILSFFPRVGSPNSCFLLLLFYSFNQRSWMIKREAKTTWFASSLPPFQTAERACCRPHRVHSVHKSHAPAWTVLFAPFT